MARGKKASGKHYTSKGERPNVNKSVLKAERRDYKQNTLKLIRNKQDAWLKMKKVWLTIPNPNKNETNKRFIRVLASDVWGDPRRSFVMGQAKEET